MEKREFERLLSQGTAKELRAAYQTLVVEKKRIEQQLCDDKADMQEERSELLRSGMDPRRAQMEATAGSDFEWRSRAVAAQRIIDSRLPQLRQRLHQLNETSQSTVALRGTVEDVQKQLLELASDGNYIQQLVPYDGAILVLYKGVT